MAPDGRTIRLRTMRTNRLLPLLPLLLVLLASTLAAAATDHQGDGELVNADRWGPISVPMPAAAVEKFEAAVVGYASLRGEVVAPLEEALALAPTYLLAHVYLGSILLLSTAVPRTHPLVQRSYAAARNLTRGGAGAAGAAGALTAREAGYWAAFQALHDAGATPDFAAAANAWEGVLDGNPRDLLAVRSAHDAYIILGDTGGLQASLARVLSREWGDGGAAAAAAALNDDRRYVKAMWAFALEENGDYARAAAVAREVLAEDPTDVTALHALAHTFEMVSAKAEGEETYKEFEGKWEHLEHSLFINHVAWHRAIFNLYLSPSPAAKAPTLLDVSGRAIRGLHGQHDQEVNEGTRRALALYDGFLVTNNGTTAPATPLAMADAASLLWRLLLRGALDRADPRWATLRRFYAQGGYETAHITSFNDMHMLLCLAVADPPAAKAALASMRRRATAVPGRVGRWLRRVQQRLTATPLEPTNVGVLAAVGLDVGEAILAFAEEQYARAARLLAASRPRWILVGGSHAQRDVFMLTLIEACVRGGGETDLLRLARELLAERASVKDPRNEEGTWDRLRAVEARLRAGGAEGARGSEEEL